MSSLLALYEENKNNSTFQADMGGPRARSASTVGFQGFTYEPGNDGGINSWWGGWATAASSRVGPFEVNDAVQILNIPTEKTYGTPGSFARIGTSTGTMLTNIAGAISEGGDATWATMGTVTRMKRTFTSGDQMKSMQLHTVDGKITIASGGPFVGFDSEHQYRITNWLDVDIEVTQEEEDEYVSAHVASEKAILAEKDEAGESYDMLAYDGLRAGDASGVVTKGVESNVRETYNGTRAITTGLRAISGMNGVVEA